jgi:nicotinamidase/pyrazinamidase
MPGRGSFVSASMYPATFAVDDVYRGPYAARIAPFAEAGQRAGLAPAEQDEERIAVILVDYQHDFVDPAGTLAVPGAQDDVARFLDWFYRNAGRITSVYASLDTHLPSQIFYPPWWVDPATGAHPSPFTEITVEEVERGRWAPALEPEWSVGYVRALRQQAKKALMIWPYHTMEGTLGHMLVAPISEAIAWHSAARRAQPTFVAKGRTMRTEYYGLFGAEVVDPADAESALNAPLLDAVMRHDRVYIAGEAKSHCVLESARQIVARFGRQPEVLRRLTFLRDCTSSVAHPAIDFDAMAERELAEMERRGVRLALSGDPL